MSNPLYQGLSDNFSTPDGSLTGYVGSDLLTQKGGQTHYNLRAFHNTDITVPWTQNDMRLWNSYHFQNVTQNALGSRRSITGRSFRGRTMTELDGLTMAQWDALTMYELDFYTLSSGNEEWPAYDTDVVVGKDSTLRYSNAIAITLHNAVTKTVTSHYHDDIITAFNDQEYYIEFVLRDFPAQGAASYLDLANSFIDFSSADNLDAAVTDSIPFSASIFDLSLGGNVVFRIPRSLLTKANLSALKIIQFRLLSVGDMTFKAQAMRLLPANLVIDEISIDTKSDVLARFVPRLGSPEPSTLFGDMYFKDTKPRDQTSIVKLNTGHNPTGNDNILKLFFRYNSTTNDRIEVRFFARDTQSRIRIYQTIGGVATEIFSTPTLTNILAQETDYYLKVDLQEGQITATLYAENGVFLGSQVYTTGPQTISYVGRGAFGYSFEPYNYDFTLDSIGTQSAIFARFESTPFYSVSPLNGSTLFTSSSAPVDMATGDRLSNGDAALTVDASGVSTITRDGSQWWGGITTEDLVEIGDSGQLYVRGEIYPVGTVQGLHRAVLVDQNESVAWIQDLIGLLPNQWNVFELPVTPNLLPLSYYFWFQQTGFYAGQWQIRNLHLEHNTISWYASSDSGTVWQPFLNAIDKRYSGMKFGTAGTGLKIKAAGLSDASWIQGYKDEVHYKYPGHV